MTAPLKVCSKEDQRAFILLFVEEYGKSARYLSQNEETVWGRVCIALAQYMSETRSLKVGFQILMIQPAPDFTLRIRLTLKLKWNK